MRKLCFRLYLIDVLAGLVQHTLAEHHWCRRLRRGLKSLQYQPRVEAFPVRNEKQVHGASNWKQFNDKKLARSTIAALLYTSGSSGTPKAAALSHFNLVARNASMLDDTTKPYEVSIRFNLVLQGSILYRFPAWSAFLCSKHSSCRRCTSLPSAKALQRISCAVTIQLAI